MYALSAETNSLFAIHAIVMGASIAAVSAVAPVFVVGARLPKKLEAKRLTTYNLVAPVGQVLGGMLLGVVATAGWSYTQRFWLAAAVMLVAFVVTWLTSKKPAERIALAMDADAIEAEVRAEVEDKVKARSTGIKGVLFSAFGAYLLVLVLSSVANNGINNQIANIMPNVYGIDEATTSALISLAGLLNIGFFLLAGWWMGRSSSLMLITTGHLLRLVGALGMALLGMMTDSPALLVVGSMQMVYQGAPFVRLAQPVTAVRFATIAAGAASGWVIGASAIGSFLGSIIGGFLADSIGFNAINWMAAVSAGLGALVLFFIVWPAERKKRAEETG
jgi:predicted MFS family arabinose efflux permease